MPQISCHFRNIRQKLAVGTANSPVHSLPSWRVRLLLSVSGEMQPTSMHIGAFDVEIRDSRRRFSGLRGNSSCCRPSTTSASAGRRAGGQISHGQISRRQEPNWEIPGRGTDSDQRLIRISIRCSAAFVGVPTQSAGRYRKAALSRTDFHENPADLPASRVS